MKSTKLSNGLSTVRYKCLPISLKEDPNKFTISYTTCNITISDTSRNFTNYTIPFIHLTISGPFSEQAQKQFGKWIRSEGPVLMLVLAYRLKNDTLYAIFYRILLSNQEPMLEQLSSIPYFMYINFKIGISITNKSMLNQVCWY